MEDRTLDELGPVDYLIVEFPAGSQNFTGEGAAELVRLHDAGIIRVMDVLIIAKDADGTIEAMELSDLPELGELAAARGAARADPGRGRRRPSRGRHGSGQRGRGPHLREPVGRPVRFGHAPRRWSARSPTAGSRSRPSSPPSKPTKPSSQKESDMPLGPGRRGVGVIGGPVAKVAVVGAVAGPGPSPVAKAAVVGAAVGPGPSPVAKAAVVGAAVTPGRRRF